jgi:hypothetical protein
MSPAEEANWELLTQYTLWIHFGLIGCFLLLLLYNYYILCKEKNFIRLAKLLKRNMIFHHSFNFSIVYTGGVMLGIIKHIPFEVVLMIFTSLFLFIGEYIRNLKQIQTSNNV